ncbi:MAG: hypothetical protein U9P49_00845 [Thermodesulfobacteriota bacterium]|nr:hypothetical protein [Thermodesulfobacteriota bacterium]
MKNLPKSSYLPWLFLILAIGLLFSGCAPPAPPDITATDGDHADKIVVEWTQGGLGDKVDHFILERSADGPAPPWGGTYAPIGGELTSLTYNDKGLNDGDVFWYKVTPYDKKGEPAPGSTWNAGLAGSTGQTLEDMSSAWSDVANCIFNVVNLGYPYPQTNPGLGTATTWYGRVSGSSESSFDLDIAGGINVIAAFTYLPTGLNAGYDSDYGYEDWSTNGFALLGEHVLHMTVPKFNGTMRGVVQYTDNTGVTSYTGCCDYYIDITDRESSGGHLYVTDGNKIEYRPWSVESLTPCTDARCPECCPPPPYGNCPDGCPCD